AAVAPHQGQTFSRGDGNARPLEQRLVAEGEADAIEQQKRGCGHAAAMARAPRPVKSGRSNGNLSNKAVVSGQVMVATTSITSQEPMEHLPCHSQTAGTPSRPPPPSRGSRASAVPSRACW